MVHFYAKTDKKYRSLTFAAGYANVPANNENQNENKNENQNQLSLYRRDISEMLRGD